MTIFAGAFSLAPGLEVPRVLKDAVSRNLRRVDDDKGSRQTHCTPKLFLTKWDSGAFSEPAWRETPDGSVCTIAGDPLLIEAGHRLNREKQMSIISPTEGSVSSTSLAKCRGSFSLAHYSAKDDRLYLATDAVGLRSVYYTIQGGFLIFSTALRILEDLPEVRKNLSFLGMAELGVFSFPLAERTPYEGINVLRECQILSTTGSDVTLRSYYDWEKPETFANSPVDSAAKLYSTFYEAVRIRAGDDIRSYSFLSGGMDSRAIVATLIKMGRHVESLNFSSSGSQDQYYAQQFAETTTSQCRLNYYSGGVFPNFSFLALAAKANLERGEHTPVDRPQLIWSGDGGSVGLGHVYMDERMLEFGDKGDIEGMVKHFFDVNALALQHGILTAPARKKLPQMLLKSVLDEVNRYPRDDIGRRLYFFLLFNDQRRHLFKHFETIDQHGLELLVPFYDAEFLKAVAATPSRWGILHRLYASFFQHLPEFALKTPWQTYPGHQPCPVPPDKNASYQWEKSQKRGKGTLVERSKTAIQIAGSFRRDMEPQVFFSDESLASSTGTCLGY